MVDENGEPHVVYHGTHGDFSAFNKEGMHAPAQAVSGSPNAPITRGNLKLEEGVA